ncbi:GFA family protein [Longispora urticae]
MEWITSGVGLYRLAKPATPPMHLVSYFQVIDPDTGCLLLGEHRKAGLLLPNGGHVEPGETPWEAVVRECAEELRLTARASSRLGTSPVFVSVTSTVGSAADRHVDVSLWHVVHARRADVDYFDEAEFTRMRWLSPDEVLATPVGQLDPCMHRFTHKITAPAWGPSAGLSQEGVAGGCLCGRIRFTVSGEPDYPHVCSCRHCQKRAGGPLQSWVSFPLDELRWTGEGGAPTWYDTFPDTTTRGFCATCGSHLAAYDYGDTLIGINLTALDDQHDPRLVPVNQSFRDDAVGWLPQVPDTQHSTSR